MITTTTLRNKEFTLKILHAMRDAIKNRRAIVTNRKGRPVVKVVYNAGEFVLICLRTNRCINNYYRDAFTGFCPNWRAGLSKFVADRIPQYIGD